MSTKPSIHPLQSFEWGTFRKKTGIKVIRENDLQLTIHKIPFSPWAIGYVPKGPMPTQEMLVKLQEIGKKEKCIFIQLEPNVQKFTSEEPPSVTSEVADSPGEALANRGWTPRRRMDLNLKPAAHPLFTNYTFILDLTKSEEELLKAMHPKTRYNIKVAQKHGVKIVEDNSNATFEVYLKLTQETTKRQGFYSHTENYHRLQWNTIPHKIINLKSSIINQLSSHLFLARYDEEILAAWIVFAYGDTMYYPYGASSNKHKEVMASNLMMWEVIRFGKKLRLKNLDMWGALGRNPSKNDPWYGFHRFKEGYGGKLTEFVGSYDLVINPFIYEAYKILDRVRWFILKLKL